MYQVTTFKSKPLKHNTIILGEDVSSPDFSEEINEIKPKKKKDDGLTYLIDGIEVREEDLTIDERLDLEAESLLNQDGFYTPLNPIDIFDQEEEVERKSGNVLKIALLVGATVLLLAGVAVAMVMFL